MNRFGGRAYIIIFFLSLSTLFLSCGNNKLEKVDFDYLLKLTSKNKNEVNKIIEIYQASKNIEEIESYEYILKNLLDQYTINYKLLKEDTVVALSSEIGIDSIIALQKHGYIVDLSDTIKDIDHIKALDLQNYVNRFIANWNSKKFSLGYTFDAYKLYVLPYRINNEPLSACINNNLNNRYPLDKLIREKAYLDTIAVYEKKIAGILNEYSKDLNGVNLLNILENEQILSKDQKITDYEDLHIYRVSMLKHHGIPAITQFIPHKKNLSVRPYSTKMIPNDFNIDSLKLENISKAYLSSFESKNWTNPFDKLLKLGLKIQNIPLSLYIPRMVDVTSNVTQTSSLKYSFTNPTINFTPDSILYLCTYTLGQWVPIDFAVLKGNEVIFDNIGSNVLYAIGSFNHGQLSIVSNPLVANEQNGYEELGQNVESVVNVSLTHESSGKKLQDNIEYGLYQWSENTWKKIKTFKFGSRSSYDLKLPKSFLYTLRDKNKELRDIRPFTIGIDKQIWW